MKNNEKLLNIIGEVDEEFIPELHTRKKRSTAKWLAIGGSVCAAVLVGAFALRGLIKRNPPIATSQETAETTETNEQTTTSSTTSTTKPVENDTAEAKDDSFVLSDEEYADILENHKIYPEYQLPTETDDGLVHISAGFEFGAMGFGGIMVFDISEYDSPNPWSEDLQLSTLPVFRNLSYVEHVGGAPVYLSEEEMLTMAKNTAAALGATIISTEAETIGDAMGNPPEEYADRTYYVTADCDTVIINVEGDGEITVRIKEPVKLDGYSFTYQNTDKEEGERTVAYLAERLRGLLQYSNPVSYTINDRNIYEEQHRMYYIYDRSDDIVQDILNYNLCYTEVYPNDDGTFDFIRMFNQLVSSEFLGNYPVISENEARSLLLNNSYISTVHLETIEESDIGKVELMYRMNDEYVLPYYLYYVDITDIAYYSPDSEMKTYGLFFVPAVRAEYLSDISVWNGSFN